MGSFRLSSSLSGPMPSRVDDKEANSREKKEQSSDSYKAMFTAVASSYTQGSCIRSYCEEECDLEIEIQCFRIVLVANSTSIMF